MITEYYILMGVIAIFGWLFILDWQEGIDPCRKPTEEEDIEQLKNFKEKLIKKQRDEI